jgi:type III restriction enzyme
MALHPNFPAVPHAMLDPAIRWFPAHEVYRDKRSDQRMPPLVAELRKRGKPWRDSGYPDASTTSRALTLGEGQVSDVGGAAGIRNVAGTFTDP